MMILNRTSIYLKRNKRRNILLVVIISVLFLSLLFGVHINNCINSIIYQYKNSLSASFSIIQDPIPYADNSQFYVDSNKDGVPEYIGPMLCLKDAESIKNYDDRITGFNAEENLMLLNVDINLIPGFFTYFYENVDLIFKERVGSGFSYDEYIEEARGSEIDAHSTWMHPVVESNNHHFFYIGAFEVVKGRHIRKGDKHVALISEQLADFNDLKVGDTIIPRQLKKYCSINTNDPYGSFGDLFPLEIIGIFKINFYQECSEWTTEDEKAENYILTDYQSYGEWLHDWRQFSKTFLDLRDDEFNLNAVSFYVRNPDDIDNIISTLEQSDVLNWQFYHIEKKNDDYDAAVKPLNNISNMILLFVLLISGGCITVLFLLINMSEKARKKETYIYRSLGIHRRLIILQRVVEMVIVSVIAFITAIIIGSFLIVPFGEYISESINNNATEADEFEVSYDSNDNLIVEKNIQPDLSLKEEIGFEEIMITFAITEGAVLLATLIASKGKKDVLILE